MRILALSDTHIGAGMEHRRDALADTDAVLAQVTALAEERCCDLVLHAGDVFHRAKPDPAELHCFKRFTLALRIARIPLLAIHGNGNHEAAHGDESALELFADDEWLQVSRRPEVVVFPSGPGESGAAVCTLPAAPLSRLAAARNGGSRAELAEEAVDLLLAAARDLFAAAPPDRPRILLAHQMVSGASLPNGLPLEALGAVLPLWALEEIGYDAIVLGDIHKAQMLSDVPFVAYCGAPMIHDFGEEANEPGVWIIDADTEGCDYEFVRLEDRRFVSVSVDLTEEVSEPGQTEEAGVTMQESARTAADGGTDPDEAETPSRRGSLTSLDETDRIAAAIAEQLPLDGAVVRVRYKATEPQHRRVDHRALERLLEDAGAHRLYGGIAWEAVRESRARAEGANEALPPLEALELWLAVQGDGFEAGETVDGLRALLGEWAGA